jgi:ubiquinone/menaquinone biosynthesis C-methylase UbiE
MRSDLISELVKLYDGQDIRVKLYVSGRLRLLRLDYYATCLPDDGTVVDVGCGYGLVANYLSIYHPKSHIIGIDLNRSRIEAAAKTIGERGNINFAVEDATKWTWPECAGVVMTDFLHHVTPSDQQKILQNAYRGLRDGGTLLISEVDPGAKPFYRYWASYLADRVLYPFAKSYFRTIVDWKSTLAQLGFKIKVVERPNLFFAGINFICRK